MFDALPDLLLTSPAGAALPAKLSKRDAIKAAGGAAYEALLAKERASRAKFRQARPGRMKELRRAWVQKYGKSKSFKWNLCSRARARGRKRGLKATITPADLVWPSHCPVLGMELDYPERSGQRGRRHNQPNWPTLDRWDNTKGYVPGNVFVISMRANTLKGSGTYHEMLKVARYMAKRPSYER